RCSSACPSSRSSGAVPCSNWSPRGSSSTPSAPSTGVLATLLDSAMGCAVHSLLPTGSGYTTLEPRVNFLRRVTTATGRIRCDGSVIHLGRTVVTAEARITDGQGRLIAHATTTCLLLGTSLDDPVR